MIHPAKQATTTIPIVMVEVGHCEAAVLLEGQVEHALADRAVGPDGGDQGLAPAAAPAPCLPGRDAAAGFVSSHNARLDDNAENRPMRRHAAISPANAARQHESITVFRNRRGEQAFAFSATDAKKQFGRVLEMALQGGAIVITRHDAPKAALLPWTSSTR